MYGISSLRVNSLLSLFLTISMFYIHTRYLDSWPIPTGIIFIHSSFILLVYFHLQINNDRLLVFCHFHYENFTVIKHWAVYGNFLLQFRSNTMFFSLQNPWNLFLIWCYELNKFLCFNYWQSSLNYW